AMRNAKDWRSFQDAAWKYRQVIADDYAGPRLRAAIRAAQTFLPRTFWATYQDIHQDVLPFYEAENAAIHRRDPDAARTICTDRSKVMARAMLAELVRRRVFTPDSERQAMR
ncbi:MAG TPA: GntR family transcriptional regulator, partial [Mycobacterium sp.]|nr:GntR family transcriptional regulator [Mycobacterium sp.]